MTIAAAQLRRVADLSAEEVGARLREVCDGELRDLLGLLLQLDPRQRPTVRR